jgi:hypothetical protein
MKKEPEFISFRPAKGVSKVLNTLMKKDKSTRSKAINRIILAFGEEKIINKQ